MGNSSSKTCDLDPSQGKNQPGVSSQIDCPVAPSKRQAIYNVYNQRIDTEECPVATIDPRNNMPLEPNQQPIKGQKQYISTYRLQSNIPKGGTDTTWLYPSPQMFYNVNKLLYFLPQRFIGRTRQTMSWKTTWMQLLRPTTVDSPPQEPHSQRPEYKAIEKLSHNRMVEPTKLYLTVLPHYELTCFPGKLATIDFGMGYAAMNEITWARVKQWESLHRTQCRDVRLRRFLGRPDELSPLARLQSWLGGQLPFDRHDWYVDRCGQEVRYVIDFYFHEDKAGTPEAFTIRARPAIDSAEAVLDRVKMKIYTTCARYGLPCPITGHASSFDEQEHRGEQQNQPA